MKGEPRIGVLALQGGFAAHMSALRRLGALTQEVRHARDLRALDGLVLPGGESTTLFNLMRDEPWAEELDDLWRREGSIAGTCAGAILLAKEVLTPARRGLGLLDATVERNAWGRQVDSFEADLPCPAIGGTLHAVFIRAPRFRRLGPGVEVLASVDGEPVFVRQGRVLAVTFHPELTGDDRFHRLFLDTVHAPSEKRSAL